MGVLCEDRGAKFAEVFYKLRKPQSKPVPAQ